MDWWDYLKAEGFAAEMTPETVRAYETLRQKQRAFVEATVKQPKEAGLHSLSPIPLGLLANYTVALGEQCNAESFAVFHTLLDVIRQLQSRIEALENRSQ